jgi:hypothetical protein
MSRFLSLGNSQSTSFNTRKYLSEVRGIKFLYITLPPYLQSSSNRIRGILSYRFAYAFDADFYSGSKTMVYDGFSTFSGGGG